MKTNESKKRRVNLSFNLDNKEDKEVFEILMKKKNMNAYVRRSVLYFNKGIRLDERTREDIREVVRESLQEFLSGDFSQEKQKKISLSEEIIEVPMQSELAKEVSEPKQENEAAVSDLEDVQSEAEVKTEDIEKEMDLDLSGLEDFFG